jgi:hypothetical protein
MQRHVYQMPALRLISRRDPEELLLYQLDVPVIPTVSGACLLYAAVASLEAVQHAVMSRVGP